MSGNSGSQGTWSGYDGEDNSPRFSRANFDRAGYEQALTGFREALKGVDASAPGTAAELYELERLIRKYPAKAREFLAALDGT
jgi:hypothetical protein